MVIVFLIVVGIQITATKLSIWFLFKAKDMESFAIFCRTDMAKSSLYQVISASPTCHLSAMKLGIPYQNSDLFGEKKATIYAFIFQEVIAHFHDLVDLWFVDDKFHYPTNPLIHPTNQLMKHLNMYCSSTDSWCLTHGDLFLFLWYIFDIFSWNVSNV